MKKKKLEKKLENTREKLVKVASKIFELESKLAKKAEPLSIVVPATKTQKVTRKTPSQGKKATIAAEPKNPSVKTTPVPRRARGK